MTASWMHKEHQCTAAVMAQLLWRSQSRLDEAQSCRHYAQPYTAAMLALQQQYGQPHQLMQRS